MTAFSVQFVYWDEATPRRFHRRTVVADNKHDAQEIALTEAILASDRIGITDINRIREDAA